jgi:hypothetical protein
VFRSFRVFRDPLCLNVVGFDVEITLKKRGDSQCLK